MAVGASGRFRTMSTSRRPVSATASGRVPATSAVGRPRVDRRAVEGSPGDEIISAATRLFAEKGYADTTMSEIARAAGLRQSSLYYWFNRKELVLQAAFAVNRAPLEFVVRIGTEPGSAGLKLYRLVRFDVRQLCQAPCDVNEVERLAALQPDVFEDFWRDRQALHDWVAQLVQLGGDGGELIESDAQLAALDILSGNEGLPNWFRTQAAHRPRSDAEFTHPPYDATTVAEHHAATVLRGLLKRPADLAKLQAKAAGFDDDP